VSRCPAATVCCGPFTLSEVPDPLVYQFQDADGAPLDLTGFTTLSFCWAERWGGAQARVAELVDEATAGTVRYVWDDGDLDTPGQYTGLFWVTQPGGRRYASVPIRFDVRTASCRVVAA
jgi:BppU N-terminal domain